jgi:ankyrin repeat protein
MCRGKYKCRRSGRTHSLALCGRKGQYQIGVIVAHRRYADQITLLLHMYPWAVFDESAGADAKVVNEDGNTALHLAGYSGCSEDIVTMLLRAGADPNALNKDNESPLAIAVRGARVEYMIRLMRLKAKVDDHGSTVVHVAAKHGLKDILQFFNRMGTSSLL